jgi:ligand-binding sensor domain-containing protein
VRRIQHKGRFELAFSSEVTANKRVWAFAQAADGAVWAATENGLVRWSQGQVRLYRQADGLPTDRLRSLAFDRDGVLWIATTGGGLVSMVGGRFQVYGAAQGFRTCRCVRCWPNPAVACGRRPPAAVWCT